MNLITPSKQHALDMLLDACDAALASYGLSRNPLGSPSSLPFLNAEDIATIEQMVEHDPLALLPLIQGLAAGAGND